ncbi:hypothetical protein KUTeg_001236 [Tegillarca granosa]|uniref:Tripartite motif-containing protein 2 n=1 Tax=Tegillarca granosa TaxID=220873 RepID=A0ABQ9FZU1_TEGGR|nr:hypothetical protein KUTeg_001236 [Tegillarca granosa]
MAAYTPTSHLQVAIENCELCQEVDAQFYCTDCQEKICNGCKTVHLRSKLSRDHNVVSTSLGRSNRKARKPIKCTIHPTEVIRMYCTSCDEAVCVKCATSIKHKNHNFEELETTLYKYQDEISQNVIETKQQIEELQKALQTIDVNVKDYTEVSAQTINGINQQRNRIKSDVDEIADDLIDQVKRQKQQDLQLMENEKKDIQKIISGHNKHLQSCEEKSKSMKDFNRIQIKLRNTKMPSITYISPLSFVSNKIMNLKDIFGYLVDSIESNSPHKVSLQGKDSRGKTAYGDSVDRSTEETICTHVISILKPDIDCQSVSAVNDKKAWCGGENDLILVNTHGHVKKEIELNKDLFDVVITSKEKLIVTEIDGSHIIKYSPDGNYRMIADTEPYITKGLCYTLVPDNILVCLYDDVDDCKVVRMTTEGHIKQTIQKDKQQKALYKNPRFVAENINEDVVVVDGSFHPIVVVVNKNGEYRFTYPDSSQSSDTINGSSGIVCDNTGCILVSDFSNHRIHQIDMDGRFIQFVLTLTHGVQCPLGMSVDNKGQLWLCNKNGKEVTIFKYRS